MKAGKDAVIWPQNPRSTMLWDVYLKVNDKTLRIRSNHMVISACEQHWRELYQNWQQIAVDELWLDFLWSRHVERSGR